MRPRRACLQKRRPSCRCGEIGRHAGLRILYRKVYRFDSDQRHQSICEQPKNSPRETSDYFSYYERSIMSDLAFSDIPAWFSPRFGLPFIAKNPSKADLNASFNASLFRQTLDISKESKGPSRQCIRGRKRIAGRTEEKSKQLTFLHANSLNSTVYCKQKSIIKLLQAIIRNQIPLLMQRSSNPQLPLPAINSPPVVRDLKDRMRSRCPHANNLNSTAYCKQKSEINALFLCNEVQVPFPAGNLQKKRGYSLTAPAEPP